MRLIVLSLLALGAVRLCAAETNAEPSAPAAAVTQITSRSVDFDLKSRQAIYRGSVRVQDPRMAMTCELLTASIPESGGRVDRIVAESNVVIMLVDKGATNRATSERAIYTYSTQDGRTNEVLELAGSPAIETPQGRLTGDSIVWDRVNDTIKATNQRMTVRSEESDSTNAIPGLKF